MRTLLLQVNTKFCDTAYMKLGGCNRRIIGFTAHLIGLLPFFSDFIFIQDKSCIFTIGCYAPWFSTTPTTWVPINRTLRRVACAVSMLVCPA
jgi:hypothetical protein